MTIETVDTYLFAELIPKISIKYKVFQVGMNVDVTHLISPTNRLVKNSPTAKLFRKISSKRIHPCYIPLERADSKYSVSICRYQKS